MGEEFSAALCEQRHNEMERRMADRERVERELYEMLRGILKKLNDMEVKLAQQSLWASIGKILLGALLGGLMAFFLRSGLFGG